jgi:hypothetical protein
MRRILLGVMSIILLVVLAATPGDNITGSAVQVLENPAHSLVIITLILLMLAVLVLRILKA